MKFLIQIKKFYLIPIIIVIVFFAITIIDSVPAEGANQECPILGQIRCNNSVNWWIQECMNCDTDAENEWCNVQDCALTGQICANGVCQGALQICSDIDLDGYGDPGVFVCPNGSATDCDDGKNYIYPGALETCDTFDNNCDGQIDEGCDDDGDQYCDNSMQIFNNTSMCANTVFTVNGMYGDDCTDNNQAVKPGATEICNDGIDQDCDGSDLACASCVITDAYWSHVSAMEGQLVLLIATGNNCDGKQVNFSVKEEDLFSGDDWPVVQPVNATFIGNSVSTTWTAEYQPDGFLGLNDPPEFYFIASLASNSGINFDSRTNPLLIVNQVPAACQDNDGDGFQDANCGGNDCNDLNAAINLGATEVCDGIDNDCDGQTDEGCPAPVAGAPYLQFSDIISGPNNGNSDPTGDGAIVTIWGNNLGNNSDEIYFKDLDGTSHLISSQIYYWKNADGQLPSGPADLYFYHKMQEIAFAIPSSAVQGLGEIYVKVNGVQSNTLPFTVRSGNIYFVKATGVDSNTGDWGNPWKTIGYDTGGATTKVNAGDIIYVGDGVQSINTYLSKKAGFRINNKVGNQNNPFALIAYPNSLILAQGAGYGIRNDGSAFWVISKYNLKAGDFNLCSSCTTSVGTQTFKGGRIIGNKITDLEDVNGPSGCAEGRQGAISGNALSADKVSNVKIYGNHIHDWGCDQTSKFMHTTYLSNRAGSNSDPAKQINVSAWEFGWNFLIDNKAKNGLHNYDENLDNTETFCGDVLGTLKIHDNVIVNQKGVGVNVATRASATAATVCWSMPVEIYNNLLINTGIGPAGSSNTAMSAMYFGGYGLWSDIKVFHNTIFGYGKQSVTSRSGLGALWIGSSPSFFPGTLKWFNNIIYDTEDFAFDDIRGGLQTQIVGSNNNLWYNGGDGNPSSPPSWDTSPITSDPLFTNPSNNDFTLQSSSPAKYAGINVGVTRDLYGNPRDPTNPSIGAIEANQAPSSDTINPVVAAFDVQPTNTTGSVTATWTVKDETGLQRVELWISPDNINWSKVVSEQQNVSGLNADSSTSPNFIFTDIPANGTWWYGLHVIDAAGNMGVEPASIQIVKTVTTPTGIIFEDDFDGHEDWSPIQTFENIVCRSDRGCATAPSGYVGYRIAGTEQCSEANKNTLNINNDNFRSESGKGFTFWSEPCLSRSGSWGSDGLLDIQLANYSEGYEEIYVRFYVKFDPNWQWTTTQSPMQKFLHVSNYQGITHPYDFFTLEDNKPRFMPGLAKWDYGSADIAVYSLHSLYGGASFTPTDYFPPTGSYGGTGTDFDDTEWSETPAGQGMIGDGKWHLWEWNLKMNTADGVADGVSRFWVDEVLIESRTDVIWVTGDDPNNRKWNYVWLGGNNYNLYSGGGEQWYAIDDLVISTNYIGPNYTIGGPPQDTANPVVMAFDVQPRTTTGSVTAIWTVTDNQALKQAELWRTDDSGGAPNPVNWQQVQVQSVSGTSDSGSFTDSPANGTWWYGLHIVDVAGNCTTEKNEDCATNAPSVYSAKGPIQIVKTAAAPVGIIFEDDFSDTGVGWVYPSSGNWLIDANLKNWDYYRVGTSNADLRTVAGGYDGTPVMRFSYDIGSGQRLAVSLGKFLTTPTQHTSGVGYDEIYVRYRVKLDDYWRTGDGLVKDWKWGRLFQNRDPSQPFGNQGESDFPKDTGFMILGTSLGENPLYPATWKVVAAINDWKGDSHEVFNKIKFSGTTSICPTCGHFESVPGWGFDTSNGYLDSAIASGYPTAQNWHTLEWHIKLSTGTCNAAGTGTENGVFEMWIDGVKQDNNYQAISLAGTQPFDCNALSTNKRGVGINWITVFDNMKDWTEFWNDATGAPAGWVTGQKYLYLNDVVVSDSYIGPSYIVP